MQLQQNTSLLPYNTFGINVQAEYFTEINNLDDLQEAASLPHQLHVLGGGSNILLTGNVNGLVAHNKLKGVTFWGEDDNHVWFEAGAGESWHEFVLYVIGDNLGGVENLALIPGSVGAAPIQNIGAYGMEVQQTIESVTFYHLEEKTFVTLSNAACKFGYRDSVFKHELKNKVFITSVAFRLNKNPSFNTSYGTIEQELQNMGVQDLSVKAIAQAVINIRSSKLPDPKVTGNAGSFFKNPTITKEQYAGLAAQYPSIPSFPVNDEMVKLPAAWLIEQCGWKGFRRGDMGVHNRQALVLVNYNKASGKELWELSGEIVASVSQKFHVTLEREVQVW